MSGPRRLRTAGMRVLGCAFALIVAYLLLWHQDDPEFVYGLEPGFPDLLAWGHGEYAFTPGVTTLQEIEKAFGSPIEEDDDDNTRVWRGKYYDGFRLHRRWLYRTKMIGSVETLFTETVVATFDDNGVLQGWRRAEPVSSARNSALSSSR